MSLRKLREDQLAALVEYYPPGPLAALASGGADTVPYFNGASTATTAPMTAYARTILAAANAAAARAALGITALAPPVNGHAALRALTPADGDCAWLYSYGPPRFCVFSSTPNTAAITRDPTGFEYIAPASAPTGSAGVWRIQYQGTIFAEWSDQFSSVSNATNACQAAWEYLVNPSSTAKGWEVYQNLTTRGFGDKNIKTEYADEASLPAAGTLSEYDVVYAQAEETLWRVRDLGSGLEYVEIQHRSLNGKSIFSNSVGKSAGFILQASSPAWMRLFATSKNDGRIHNIMFNGNNPSTQWPGYAGLQNNTLTEVLVYTEGYGRDWSNCVIRFSGGDAMWSKGIIGNDQFSGGDMVWQYNNGCGLKFLRGSSVTVKKGWVEGNDGPGFLLKHDMLAAASDAATARTYMRNSGITIEDLYSENDNDDYPDIQIEGGHYAPRLHGGIAKHGTGANRTQVYLKNTGAEADGLDMGCQGGYFELWGTGTRVEIESEARGNVFIRQGDFWTSSEASSWIFNDNGRDNVCRWVAPDAHAFIPGTRISATSLNGDSTNFVDDRATATGKTVILPGGALGPIHDSHPDHAATSGGPGYVRFYNMETRRGQSGSYTYVGTTVTCTVTNHGIPNGGSVTLDFTSGDAADGTYTATVTGKDTFTVTVGVGPTVAGNVSITQAQVRCTARNDAACNSAQTYYCLLVIDAEAYQSVYLVLYDSANNEYYNWNSGLFTAAGSADVWGYQLRIRAERGQRYFLVPFTGSAGGVARNIRPEVRITGSGTADVYHAGCTDIDDTALFAVINGVHVGANDNPVCPIGTLPPASSVPRGTSALVTDAEAPVLGAVVATGAGTDVWCRVSSDLTDWRAA